MSDTVVIVDQGGEQTRAQAALAASQAVAAYNNVTQVITDATQQAVATVTASAASSAQAAAASASNAANSASTAAAAANNAQTSAATSSGNAATSTAAATTATNAANLANSAYLAAADYNYQTYAAMTADLSPAAGKRALCNDTDETKRGVYIKTGASGTGSWGNRYLAPMLDLSVGTSKIVAEAVTYKKLSSDVKAQLSTIDSLVSDTKNIIKNANWQYGTLSGNTIDTSLKTRRWAEIPVELNKPLTLKFASSNWQVGFYPVDQNNQVFEWQGYYSADVTYTPVKVNDSRYVAKLRLLTKYTPDSTELTDVLMDSFDVALNVGQKSTVTKLQSDIAAVLVAAGLTKLKIMSCNAGVYYDGITAVPMDKIDSQAIKWRKMFADNDCDMVLGQEFYRYFDVNSTVEAIPLITGFKYNYSTVATGGYGDVTLSKVALANVTSTPYSNGNGRKYVKGYTTIGGKNVCIINTHLSYDVNPAVHRAAEIAELIAAMNKETYVVVCCDFNVFTKSEFDAFKNAGYQLCNGGIFGWFDSWTNLGRPDNGWTNHAIDNIIVSQNIKIQNVKLDDRQLSDHAPLIAELLIS